MVQSSIIVAATDPPPCTFTGSLQSYIISPWNIPATSVSPPVIPTRVPRTNPSLTSSLFPCGDTKEVTSPPPSSQPPPDLRHTSNTWFPIMNTLLFWSDMEFIKEQVVVERT